MPASRHPRGHDLARTIPRGPIACGGRPEPPGRRLRQRAGATSRLITPAHIAQLVEPFRSAARDAWSARCCIRALRRVDARQVNKVVFGASGRALYFSEVRHPASTATASGASSLQAHRPLRLPHGPRSDAFHRLPPSIARADRGPRAAALPRERHLAITVRETTDATIGVDTEEDLRAAEARLTTRR